MCGTSTSLETGGRSLNITEIRVSLRNDDRLRAFVNVTFDGAFVVRGMKVVRGDKGVFLAMPSRRRPDGTFEDIAHPVSSEARGWLETQVMDEYRAQVRRRQEEVGIGPIS